jgi:hypothetical protein
MTRHVPAALRVWRSIRSAVSHCSHARRLHASCAAHPDGGPTCEPLRRPRTDHGHWLRPTPERDDRQRVAAIQRPCAKKLARATTGYTHDCSPNIATANTTRRCPATHAPMLTAGDGLCSHFGPQAGSPLMGGPRRPLRFHRLHAVGALFGAAPFCRRHGSGAERPHASGYRHMTGIPGIDAARPASSGATEGPECSQEVRNGEERRTAARKRRIGSVAVVAIFRRIRTILVTAFETAMYSANRWSSGQSPTMQCLIRHPCGR